MPDLNTPPDYAGPIEPGMRFIWEPLKPHAWCRCLVVEVRDRPGDERMILCEASGGLYPGFKEGERSWVEESRFREAVIPEPAVTAFAFS
jgi:hypothetical protein